VQVALVYEHTRRSRKKGKANRVTGGKATEGVIDGLEMVAAKRNATLEGTSELEIWGSRAEH
jgi:hypothetical protein